MIYIWKNLEGLVPNSGVEIANINERQGRKVKVPSLQAGGGQAIQTLRIFFKSTEQDYLACCQRK